MVSGFDPRPYNPSDAATSTVISPQHPTVQWVPNASHQQGPAFDIWADLRKAIAARYADGTVSFKDAVAQTRSLS